MKIQFLVSTVIVSISAAIAMPKAAPAQSMLLRLAAPKAKVGSAIPLERRLTERVQSTLMPTEACLFDDSYANGATNAGTTFCTRLLGWQALPQERQGKISAADVPDGYVLTLYAGLEESGATCQLIGNNPGLAPSCDNMAWAISLQPKTGTARADQANDARRQAEDVSAQAIQDGEAITKGIRDKAEREAEEQRLAEASRESDERWRRFSEGQIRERENDYNHGLSKWREQPRGAYVLSSLWAIVEPSKALLQPLMTFDFDRREIWGLDEYWNNNIEVIVITLPEVELYAYEDYGYQGRSIELSCGKSELSGDVANAISSVRVRINTSPGGRVCSSFPTKNVSKWGQRLSRNSTN